MADLLSGARIAFALPKGFHPLLRWQTPTRLLGIGNLEPPSRRANPDTPTFTAFALDLPGPQIVRLGKVRPYVQGWPGVFSPDGAWVLQRSQLSEIGLHIQALSLDGRHRQRWVIDPEIEWSPRRRYFPASTPLWTHQGRGWVQLVFSYRTGSDAPAPYPLLAVTGRIDHPGKFALVLLGRTSEATGGGFIWNGIDYGQLIDSPDGDLLQGVHLLRDRRKPRQPHLFVYQCRISAKGADRQERAFSLDEGFDAVAVEYSRATRRLAVLARSPAAPNGPWRVYCLSLDGRQQTFLGEIRGRHLSGLQWLPSGRQLSLDDGTSYWVVDIPGGGQLAEADQGGAAQLNTPAPRAW